MRSILSVFILLVISAHSSAAVSVAELDRVISRFEDIYSVPFLEETYKDLVFFKDFKKVDPIAYIEKKSLFYRITLEKGLILDREITSDSVALIICHELGHALGGELYKKSKTFNQMGDEILTIDWATAEGQADYYASSVCMKKYFEGDYNTDAIYGKSIPRVLEQNCNKAFSDVEDIAICIRTGLAVIPIIELINTQNKRVSLSTPDTRISDFTILNYPDLQCRMDTFFQGALLNERPKCWYKAGHEGNATWSF